MKILYIVAASKNALYDGKFYLNGRYRTYGQHSFIYDFAVGAARRKLEIDLAIDGIEQFPITVPISKYCNVHDFHEIDRIRADWTLLIVDVVDEHHLCALPRDVPVFCIIHNAAHCYSEVFKKRCDRFVCMTENAMAFQAKSINSSKLLLNRQGVDLNRFVSRSRNKTTERIPKVLVYSRLDGRKEDVMVNVVRELVRSEVALTVVGDGDAFWHISDELGMDITLINYIPCHSIHNFLPNFDVIVSSGRGVMESLASGVPAICAGLGYGGPVLPENVKELLKANLTEYCMGCNVKTIMTDIRTAMQLDTVQCRQMAEELFDVDSFIEQLTTDARDAAIQMH